jgi:hypothetical protein|tara:strand:+ start:1456 stop:1689 length:234 start_codon:yes stop_codon:yes gene_type:complete
MSRKYIILDTNELDSLNFSELKTTSKNTARKKLDNLQAIVSYEGTIPSGLSGKTEYTNDQLLAIVNDVSNGWLEEED